VKHKTCLRSIRLPLSCLSYYSPLTEFLGITAVTCIYVKIRNLPKYVITFLLEYNEGITDNFTSFGFELIGRLWKLLHACVRGRYSDILELVVNVKRSCRASLNSSVLRVLQVLRSDCLFCAAPCGITSYYSFLFCSQFGLVSAEGRISKKCYRKTNTVESHTIILLSCASLNSTCLCLFSSVIYHIMFLAEVSD
jgi:hypothetical protein